jgi:hypothetical protein
VAQTAKDKLKKRVDTNNSDADGNKDGYSGLKVDVRKSGKEDAMANRCLPFSISQGLKFIFSNEPANVPSKSQRPTRGNITGSLEGQRNCHENRIISSSQLIAKTRPSPRTSEDVSLILILHFRVISTYL